MVSARNIVIGVLALTFTLVVTISVSTHGFKPQSRQSMMKISSTLPVMVLRMDSPDGKPIDVDAQEEFVTAYMDVIGRMGSVNTFQKCSLPYDDNSVTERYKIGIHIRGQSTRGSQKKAFSVKMYDYDNTEQLKKKEYSLFGFPKQDKYALYSATVDPSLVRNQFSFELSRDMGRYAPRMQYVELFIAPTNTTTEIYYPQHYHGVYLFAERIHRGDDFVDVKKMKEEDNADKAVTGGYIFKVDKYGKGNQDLDAIFTTDHADYIITEPSDEVLTPEKYAYLHDYVVSVENAILSPNHTSNETGQHYSTLIDDDSFVDTFIIQEFSKNVDAYRLSSYFSKDRNGKMVSGPVWDLDRTYGNELFDLVSPEGFMISEAKTNPNVNNIPDYWPALFEDPQFTGKIKERWTYLRNYTFNTDRLMSMINIHQTELEESGAAYRDYNRWGNWYFPFMFWVTESYSEYHIRLLKEWTVKRLDWMDDAIASLPSSPTPSTSSPSPSSSPSSPSPSSSPSSPSSPPSLSPSL